MYVIWLVIRLGDFLGSGQFGTVYRGLLTVQDKETQVAVKTLHANPHIEDKVRFLQEAAIMGQFKHPNVVKMYGVVTEEEPVRALLAPDNNKNIIFSLLQFMIVLELLARGNLREHLKSLRYVRTVDSL